jgi:hypothetical protein
MKAIEVSKNSRATGFNLNSYISADSWLFCTRRFSRDEVSYPIP